MVNALKKQMSFIAYFTEFEICNDFGTAYYKFQLAFFYTFILLEQQGISTSSNLLNWPKSFVTTYNFVFE